MSELKPLRLKEYKAKLDAFIKEKPSALDLIVCTARDDEGNGFNAVWYDPSTMTVALDNTNDNNEIDCVCLN